MEDLAEILRVLREAGVQRYTDERMEVEFAPPAQFDPRTIPLEQVAQDFGMLPGEPLDDDNKTPEQIKRERLAEQLLFGSSQ